MFDSIKKDYDEIIFCVNEVDLRMEEKVEKLEGKKNSKGTVVM